MNWQAVRARNARVAARKKAGEKRAQAAAVRYAELGGDVKVGELRAATRETVTPTWGTPFVVWVFRGRRWIVCQGIYDGAQAHLYTGQTTILNYMELVNLTPGAAKWFVANRDLI